MFMAYIYIFFIISIALIFVSPFCRFGPNRKGGWLSDKKKICERKKCQSYSNILLAIYFAAPAISPSASATYIYFLPKYFNAILCENSQYFYVSERKRKTEQSRAKPNQTHTKKKHIYNANNIYIHKNTRITIKIYLTSPYANKTFTIQQQQQIEEMKTTRTKNLKGFHQKANRPFIHFGIARNVTIKRNV